MTDKFPKSRNHLCCFSGQEYSTVTRPIFQDDLVFSMRNVHQISYCPMNKDAKSLQSCPTLCDPIDGSPPDSLVPGILQARTLEWVAISFSNAWKWKVKVKSLSRVRPSATPRTAAFQVPPSMGFSRQEYWSGVPLPYPEQIWVIFKSNMPSLSLCPNYKRHQNTPCSVSHCNTLSVEEGKGFETSK